MKTLTAFFLVVGMSITVLAKENDYSNLYREALTVYFNRNGKIEQPIDTVIVQKSEYLPTDLPDFINNHCIKYLSKKEIDNYYGKNIEMVTMSPVKQDGVINVIKVRTFGYRQMEKLWETYGVSEYKFHYNPQTQKFDFLGIITM